MPSRLQVYTASIREIEERWQRTKEHRRHYQDQYEHNYRRWQQGRGSQRAMDEYSAKLRNVEYALNHKLPSALDMAYRKWLMEYWYVNGVSSRVPGEIVSMIAEHLGNNYTRSIEREVERKMAGT